MIAIVGAGPAGLFCASKLTSILKKRPARIIVIEKGKPANQRYLSEHEWLFKPAAVLEGEGGPGFLADAKLCVSAEAGTQFERSFRDIYPKAIQDLDFHIYASLLELGHEVRRFQPNPYALAAAARRLTELDLTLESYPVRALGSDLARKFLATFVHDMRQGGVEFQFETEITNVKHQPTELHPFTLTLKGPAGVSTLTCSQLVLAVGRSGASWLSRQKLLRSNPNHLDIGMRLEFPRWGGEQVRELGENPKVKWNDGRSYAKTHCFVHGGRVISYLMEDDCLVDAHAVTARKTGASSINVLYRVDENMIANPRKIYEAVTRTVNEVAPQQPLKMPLPEFLGGENLPDSGYKFSPTLPEANPADFLLIFPERITRAIRELIQRLSRFAPGIAVKQSVLYGPAAEWLSPKIEIQPHFRVAGVENLWCIGDASGRTSGVLPAAASGVVAAIQISADSKQTELTTWGFL